MAGAYGDMVATLGLDDRMFERGLRGAEQKAARTGSRIGSEFGRAGRLAERDIGRSMDRIGMRTARVAAGALGMGSAVGAASRSIEAYAKISDGAAASVSRLEKAQRSFMESVGRDFAQSGLVDDLATTIGMLESGRSSAVDFLTDLFGGDAKGLRSAASLDESVSKRMRGVAYREASGLDAEIAVAQATGDTERADELAAKRAGMVARASAAAAGLTGEALNEARDRAMRPFQVGREARARDRMLEEFGLRQGIGFTRQETTARNIGDGDEIARVNAERAYRSRMLTIERSASMSPARRGLEETAASEEHAAALRNIELEAEARKRAADQMLRYETRALEIGTLRTRGYGTLADRAEALLTYERQIDEVMSRRDISPDQRSRFVRAAQEARDQALGAGGGGGDRSLAVGLGPSVNAQVLGGGSGTPGEKSIVAELKRANQKLGKIEAKSGTWT